MACLPYRMGRSHRTYRLCIVGRRRRRGAVIVLAAILMTVLVGMAAFAIDCGVITLAQTQLQNAADAGAMAGAAALASGPSAAQDAAQMAAQANTVGGNFVSVDPTQDVQFGKWDKSTLCFTPLSGADRTNADAVKVTCLVHQSRRTQLRLFFAPIFGRSSAAVTAQAIAKRTSVNCGPFTGLNGVSISGGIYTDSYDSSKGNYASAAAGRNGHVCSNGNISLIGGGTVVNGDAHPGAGQNVSTTGGASVVGSQTPLDSGLSEPAVDPGDAATVNNNAGVPNSATNKDPLSDSGSYSLSGGDIAWLPPGTYYFSSLNLSDAAAIAITGKTIIYVTGDVNVSGGSIVNITQKPANCQLYCMGRTVALSTSTKWYGVIYAPTADVIRSGGSADFFGMAVGRTLSLSGGGGCHYDESLGSMQSATSGARLVQ